MASLRLQVYFTPDFRIIFYCNNILTAYYNRSITVKKPHWLLLFLMVTWFNTSP